VGMASKTADLIHLDKDKEAKIVDHTHLAKAAKTGALVALPVLARQALASNAQAVEQVRVTKATGQVVAVAIKETDAQVVAVVVALPAHVLSMPVAVGTVMKDAVRQLRNWRPKRPRY
jgi:hypothetical protein